MAKTGYIFYMLFPLIRLVAEFLILQWNGIAADGFDVAATLGRPQIQNEMIGYELTLLREPTIRHRD